MSSETAYIRSPAYPEIGTETAPPEMIPGTTEMAPPSSSSPYVILCDAGSTGTRLYVYSLPSSATTSHEVQIQEGPKICPGLSSQTPATVGTYLLPAFEAALDMIPGEFHATTPVYVYATAGMRLLPLELQTEIYDALAQGLTSPEARGIVPFVVERENLGTIDGTDEGYFAALAVNYLSGVIGPDLITLPTDQPADSDGLPDRNDLDRNLQSQGDRGLSWFGSKKGAAGNSNSNNGSHRTLLGALDLGGASAQIVFDAALLAGAPPATRRRLQELQNGRSLGLGLRGANEEGVLSMEPADGSGRSVSRNDFFSLSLLGYGGSEMRESVDAYLEEVHARNLQQRGGGRTRKRRLQAANLQLTQRQTQRNNNNNNRAMAQRLMKKNKKNNNQKAEADVDPNTIANPCYPPGYTVTLPSGYIHTGSGQGDVCMEHLDAVMERNARGSCDPGQFCVDLLGPGVQIPNQETFFAFTLFSYPLDFARDVLAKIKADNGGKLPRGSKAYKELHRIDRQLQDDNPSISTLRDVTRAACTWDYPWLLDALPDEDRVAHRCMELGLATSILTKFGFPENGRNVHFTDEIGGAAAEWTLGAYLHLLNHGGRNDAGTDAAAAAPDGGSWYAHPTNLIGGMGMAGSTATDSSGLLYSDVAIVIGALLSLAFCARMVVKRSWVSSVGQHAREAVAGANRAVGRVAPSRSISMPIR